MVNRWYVLAELDEAELRSLIMQSKTQEQIENYFGVDSVILDYWLKKYDLGVDKDKLK